MIPNKSLQESTIEHLILASKAADEGNEAETKDNIDKARTFAELYSRRLKMQGRLKESVFEMQAFALHAERIKSFLQMRISKKECECECDEKCPEYSKCENKGAARSCGYMIKKSDLKPLRPLEKEQYKDYKSGSFVTIKDSKHKGKSGIVIGSSAKEVILKICKDIKQANPSLKELTIDDFRNNRGVIYNIKNWLNILSIDESKQKEIIEVIKDGIFNELKQSHIEDNYYNLLQKLSEQI